MGCDRLIGPRWRNGEFRRSQFRGYDVCVCGGRKTRTAAKCLACELARIAPARAVRAARFVCACGARKTRQWARCQACAAAARAASKATRLQSLEARQARLVQQRAARHYRDQQSAIERQITRALRREQQARRKQERAPCDHVCPNCGVTFMGRPRCVYCSMKCRQQLTHHNRAGKQRYPSLDGMPVAERNQIARLVALVRAARRVLNEQAPEIQNTVGGICPGEDF